MFNLLKRSDVRQVRQVLSGQSEAFAPLVDRYLPAVYAVSYAYLGNHADAEDVTQEAFVAAYTSLHTLREPKKFEGWVVSIARQTASKLRRKQGRERAATAALRADAIHQADPGREELRRLLRAEIERMEDEPREVLLLHYHAGMNAREIAAALDINREAVKKRLQRARQTLSENLLAVIGEEARPKTDYVRQRSAIMGLVAATGVGWGTGAAASVGSRGLTSVAFPMKLGGAALAVVVILGAAYVSTRSMPSGVPSAEMVADGLNNASLKPALAENVALPLEVTAGDNAVAPGGSPEESPAAASLTGYWRACNLVANRGFFSSWNGKSDVVYLEQIDDAVTLFLMSNGEIRVAMGHGTIAGDRLRLAIPTSDGPMIGKQASIKSETSNPAANETEPAAPDIAPVPVPAGESLPAEEVAVAQNREEAKDEDAPSSTQELVCTGSLSNGDSMMLSCIVEGGTKNPTFTHESEFTRLTERDVAELKIMAQRIHEMEILATALKAYHTAYPSTFPEELSELSDGFLDSRQLIVSSGSRIVEYSPNSPWIQGYSERPEEVTSQHFLLQRERDALAGWPDFPNTPPLLRIRYSTPPMILQIREANPSSVARVDPGNRMRCSSSPPTPATPEMQVRFIEACQSNMGQLGIVLKMFAVEAEEGRIPAGWASIIPDFLADTNALTCPSVTGAEGFTRSVSYELLFPTINEEELTEVAFGMGLGALEADAMKRRMPVIIENHPCADGKSRNVVFWDGHAERIEDARWADVIAPFVRAGDKYVADLLPDVG